MYGGSVDQLLAFLDGDTAQADLFGIGGDAVARQDCNAVAGFGQRHHQAVIVAVDIPSLKAMHLDQTGERIAGIEGDKGVAHIHPVPEGYLEYKTGPAAASSGKAARSVYDLDRRQMVRTGLFYVALIAFAFGCTSGMMVISQVSAIMQESFALTATEAALYVSVMSFMSMSGRFLWGIVTDHFDKYITLSIICGLPVLAMGALAVSDSMPLTVVCLAVTALCYGGFGSTITPITADLFGAAHVTENYGVMYLAFGFAGLAGPQIAVTLSAGGDYSMAFLAACVISAVAFAMALIVRKKVRAIEA